MYCEPETATNWTSISEAKEGCMNNSRCSMFYDRCGRGNEFMYCSHSVNTINSGCGSILHELPIGKCLK